jgi:NADH:ubiquinone oxidoreductase subunit F (NADH-binding)
MTAMTSAPVDARRLLGPVPELPLPHVTAEELIALVEEAGLTGRGGAGFPTARKLRSVTGHSPVVVGNAMEGEPASAKDAVLLTHSPGLVVDGLSLVGAAVRARRIVLALGPRVPDGPVREAARRSRVEIEQHDGGFVAGQESALVNLLDGRPGIPSDPLVPVYRKGVNGRPTLVLNAETLAQVALLARHGAGWFRTLGTPSDPGTFLATLSATSTRTMGSPGVVEVPRGTPLRAVLGRARTDLERVRAVLVGGYHGAWVPRSDLDVLLTRDDLARFGASPGAGVLLVLDRDTCPLEHAATVATYLARHSARQCGPCVNGLPRLADGLRRLAVPGVDVEVGVEVDRIRQLVRGRGACAHPDGTARFVGSTLQVFDTHVRQHLGGDCDAGAR